jgi:hypothetical protein
MDLNRHFGDDDVRRTHDRCYQGQPKQREVAVKPDRSEPEDRRPNKLTNPGFAEPAGPAGNYSLAWS